MMLRDAIIRAAPFASTEKEKTAHHYVRLLPPYGVGSFSGLLIGQTPGVVVASDGDVGIIVAVDGASFTRCPDVCVDAKAVVTALKQLGKAEIDDWAIRRKSPTSVSLEGRQTFLLDAMESESFPPLPPFPSQLRPFESMASVERVLHAAAKDVKANQGIPELTGIHFAPGLVEASDMARMARAPADVFGDDDVLVPKDAFKRWKSYRPMLPRAGYADGWAFFWNAGELRWARCLDVQKFYDLSSVIPPPQQGHRVVFDRIHLRQSVMAALKSTSTTLVELRFAQDTVTILGIEQDGGIKYSETLPARGASEFISVMVRGAFLTQPLDEIEAEHVVLCYSRPPEPLRLEAPGLLSVVWPILFDAAAGAGGPHDGADSEPA